MVRTTFVVRVDYNTYEAVRRQTRMCLTPLFFAYLEIAGDVMARERWIELLGVDDLPTGRQRFVETRERELAVFHLSDPDRFVVVDNSCPHAGGNLSAGEIEDGCAVVCPWHLWSFNLDNGECTLNEQIKLHRYQTKIENGKLFALLGP